MSDASGLVFLSIDGARGSGKTTLAESLRLSWPADRPEPFVILDGGFMTQMMRAVMTVEVGADGIKDARAWHMMERRLCIEQAVVFVVLDAEAETLANRVGPPFNLGLDREVCAMRTLMIERAVDSPVVRVAADMPGGAASVLGAVKDALASILGIEWPSTPPGFSGREDDMAAVLMPPKMGS